jgi:hypothetical protein
MGQKRQIKLSYASRLSLAAMTLLLPLIVFTFILVNDRNAQIRAAQNEIAGLEYLVEFRQLLELVPRHRGLIQLTHRGDQGFDKEIEIIELAIDAEFDLSEIRAAVEAGGHKVIKTNSGKQYLDCQESITPDLLLVSFNTTDMQAPMMVRLLKDAAYPKVLMIPPSMADMNRFNSLPGGRASAANCPAAGDYQWLRCPDPESRLVRLQTSSARRAQESAQAPAPPASRPRRPRSIAGR